MKYNKCNNGISNRGLAHAPGSGQLFRRLTEALQMGTLSEVAGVHQKWEL